jgi:hypothetical protein
MDHPFDQGAIWHARFVHGAQSSKKDYPRNARETSWLRRLRGRDTGDPAPTARTRAGRVPAAGADGASHVRWHLSSCRPRPAAAGGPAQPRHRGCSWVACGARDHPRRPPHASGDEVPALPGARSPRRPPGCSVDAAPLLCVVVFPTTPPWTPASRRLGGSP